MTKEEIEQKCFEFLVDKFEDYNEIFLEEEELEEKNSNEVISEELLKKYIELRTKYRKIGNVFDEFLEENSKNIDKELYQDMESLQRLIIDAEYRVSDKYFEGYLNLLQNKFEVHDEKMTKHEISIIEHDKNILNMMGIFLAIFSLIGINISFFTGSLGQNLEICEFLKYLAGVNLILVIAIMTVFEMIKRYTKNN